MDANTRVFGFKFSVELVYYFAFFITVKLIPNDQGLLLRWGALFGLACPKNDGGKQEND